MAQPINKKIVNTKITKKKTKKQFSKGSKKHQEYGTSKLEERFAKDFLDKLGIDYVYQFKAEDIGRYYDFLLKTASGGKILLEIDGDYFHGFGLKFEQKNPMQKHNEMVDNIKDRWALLHGIPIIRIWEHDINKNPEKVIKILKETLGIAEKKQCIKENKKKRH